MARFRFQIDVEPKDIPQLDDSHKRDCADVLTGIINSVLKYTLIMSVCVVAFFALYSFFSFIYYMRMYELLPQMPFLLPILGIVIFVMEFISGTMQRWAIILEILLHGVLLFISATNVYTLIIIPFVIYGIVQHFKLITLVPVYKILSQQKGFPEFTPLPTKEEIAEAMKNKNDIKQ